MVRFYLYTSSLVMKCIGKSNQDNTLTGTLATVDVATKENLDNLEKFGEALLKKPVSRVNVDNGQLEPLEHGATNMEELKAYVHDLPVHIYINIVICPVLKSK